MRTDDGYIISKCLNGEPEAFGILVDKYKSSIFAFVYTKLRNFHDTQDITQEVFIKAYRELHTLKRWDSFAGWIYRIAYNKCKDSLISKSRRPDCDFIEDQSQHTLEEPSINSYRNDMMCQELRDALDSLPEIYREVLTLYYLGGMDSVEIANVLSTSPTAIRHRLSRAREQLKEEVLAMMNENFAQQRLGSSFTFRVVEAIKRIKIHPVSQTKGLPWGLSLATGLIIAVISLNPHLVINNLSNIISGSSLPVKSRVLKVGEIPVDVTKIDEIPFLSSMLGKGSGGTKQPDVQNAFFLAPQGGGGEWTKKTDMPTARLDLSSAVVDGKVYVIGGAALTGPQPGLSVMEEYNPATNIWTKKADMPTARAASFSIAIEGKIYVIGGITDNSNVVSTVEEYDPVANKWTKKTDIPTARAVSHSASVVKGKIYVIGGTPDNNAVISTVEEYDPVTDKWAKKTDMPTPRCYCSSSVINGKVYVIGGTPDGKIQLSIVEEYDPTIDKWTRKTDMPTARLALCTNVSGGKIYAIGGWNGSTLSTVEAYDPKTDKWTKEADMPTARHAFTASEVNGKIYVVGGIGAGPNWQKGLSSIEEYTPEGWQPEQSVSPQGKLLTTWGQRKLDR